MIRLVSGRMAETISGTIQQSARRHEPIRKLLRAGNNDAAIVQLSAITLVNPDDLAARELLFDAFFQKRDYPPALVLAQDLVRRQPGNPRLHRGLIATLSNMKRYDETITRAPRYLADHGDERPCGDLKVDAAEDPSAPEGLLQIVGFDDDVHPNRTVHLTWSYEQVV